MHAWCQRWRAPPLRRRGSRRCLRRLPSTRGHRRIAHRGREARDSTRHDPHARHRQSPQAVLHRWRGSLRLRHVPGQRFSLPRAGSDLRGGDPVAPQRRLRFRRRLEGRRRLPDDPRPRHRPGHAQRPRHRAHGPQRADGQSRPADERKRSARRRLVPWHLPGDGAPRIAGAHDRRNRICDVVGVGSRKKTRRRTAPTPDPRLTTPE
jgi:hypothetical protein